MASKARVRVDAAEAALIGAKFAHPSVHGVVNYVALAHTIDPPPAPAAEE